MTPPLTSHFHAPAMGPLLTIHGSPLPAPAHRSLRISLGFAPSWGPPLALVLAAPHNGLHDRHVQVVHVLPWPECHALPDGSPGCVQAFDLKESLWREHASLTFLLAYGFESLVAIKRSQLAWPKHLPKASTLSWPHTWWDGVDGGTCFVASSCQYPAGLLDGAPQAQTWKPGPADASFARLCHWRQQANEPQPAFALLMGDQVYVDATAGLFDPQAMGDRYVKPYLVQMQHAYRNEALHNLPLLCLPDDHEIHNDWQPAPHTRIGPAREQARDAGITQYWWFQRMQAPGPHIWQTVHQHGASFFLADSRTERSARTAATIDAARIMGAHQHQALIDWLAHEGPQMHPKFLVCPSAVLPRRRRVDEHRPASALYSDAWDGYPTSLYQLLSALCDHEVQRLVMLSGDEHLPSLARITVQRLEHAGQAPRLSPHRVVHLSSVHSSGWYSPFPFANTAETDLRGADVFEFSVGAGQGQRRHYRCTVDTTFYPGDGCALVQTSAQGHIRFRFLKGQASLEPADWIDL